MANRFDVARGRDIVARWCTLAEQRLQHLTELFESGRWRRYHTEQAFLENIEEAKAAVATWHDLLAREEMAADISRLSQRKIAAARIDDRLGQVLPFRVSPTTAEMPSDIAISDLETPAVAPAPEAMPTVDLVETDINVGQIPDIAAMQDRYPFLRNTL